MCENRKAMAESMALSAVLASEIMCVCPVCTVQALREAANKIENTYKSLVMEALSSTPTTTAH